MNSDQCECAKCREHVERLERARAGDRQAWLELTNPQPRGRPEFVLREPRVKSAARDIFSAIATTP